MNSLHTMWLRACAILAIAGATLSSCSVSTDGPAMSGASHGALASQDMSDYYYKTDKGWTYIFSNVEQIYNSDNTVTTLTGSPDTVVTLGFDNSAYAPGGDSIFRYEIHYRVLSSFAGRNPMNIWYVTATGDDDTHGAFIDGDPTTIDGATMMNKRPRPVSTDTILAGIAGRIRSISDDFTNTGTYVSQIDTLWTTGHLDSVFIWERFNPGGPLQKERCLFIRNFTKNNSWIYDLTNPSNSTTYSVVQDASTSVSVPYGSFSNAAEMRIKTNEIDDHDFNREYKWYAVGKGLVKQYDWWYVTSDGQSFTKHDFTRSLLTLTHN